MADPYVDIGDYRYTLSSTFGIVRVKVIDKTKSSYGTIQSSVTISGNTYDVVSMEQCFLLCASLTTSPEIPNSITIMGQCFHGCTSLIAPPSAIPDGVTNMSMCFYDCTSLTTVPAIPNKVQYLTSCFHNCTSLTVAPTIPSSVTHMNECFRGCTSLTVAPMIFSNTTEMLGCFRDCTSLTTAPIMPSNVKYIRSCFYGCTSLTTAPVIPSNVISMATCFENCTALTGDIYIYSPRLVTYNHDDEGYLGCFEDTTQPITIHSMNNNVNICDTLARTANNHNITVNVRSQSALTFDNTQMNYIISGTSTPLSLQTNANLVQCTVPDLINGSTITTNVNDALIDVYHRIQGSNGLLENILLSSNPYTSDNLTISYNSDGFPKAFILSGAPSSNQTRYLIKSVALSNGVYNMSIEDNGTVPFISEQYGRMMVCKVNYYDGNNNSLYVSTHFGYDERENLVVDMTDYSDAVYAIISMGVRVGANFDAFNTSFIPRLIKVRGGDE